MEFGELLQILQQGGMVALLLIIIVGGYRQWWVFGWMYKEVKADRDLWANAALKSTDTTKRATDTTDTSAKIIEQAIKIMERRSQEG